MEECRIIDVEARIERSIVGKNVEIILKTSIKQYIDNNIKEENILSYSKKLFQKSDDELFHIISD